MVDIPLAYAPSPNPWNAMRRRAQLMDLRGSDPILLEVQLSGILSRPAAQIEPPNVCDLFALAESGQAPKAIRTRLQGFLERARAEMREIVDGPAMKRFVEELEQVDAARIPASFRSFLEELASREGRDDAGLRALLERIAPVEPEPFVVGAPKVVVKRAVEPEPARSSARKRKPRSAGGRSTGASRTKKAKPAPVVDVDKMNWIRDVLIERIASASENGLGEHVLIAGVRHRARSVYPRLGAHEVTAVLQDLRDKGLVKKRAGRWSRAR